MTFAFRSDRYGNRGAAAARRRSSSFIIFSYPKIQVYRIPQHSRST